MSAKDYVLRGAVPMDSNPMPNHIWAFDLGKGSIGEAVRVGPVFKHKASLLIPGDFAETRTARTRRRMWRTRQAHHAREQWLREVFQAAGLGDAILQGRQVGKVDGAGNPIPREEWPRRKGKWVGSAKGDRRLEQEFPSEGDDTCYTSCLLRIKLLRGEKLEPWQVFKAFHSAIQRRGYDPDIPWKTREARRKGEAEAPDDEAGTQQRMRDFEKALHAMAPGQPDCQFPAYFDAWKMKLWHPAQPGELKLRVDCHAASTRNQIVPRRLVEAEIRRMVDGAAKHYPALAGQADYLLYGPALKPYASYNANPSKPPFLREGAATDWQGVVGQKIPRFDNRIIAKCALIPRLNVCKLREGDKGEPHPQSLVAVEVAFLMKLKNLRFQRAHQQASLSAAEIRSILEDPKRTKWAITRTVWRKYCERIGAVTLPGHEEVESPRFSGRSRFCRPALDILKRLILSGQKPSEFLREELARLNGNNDPLKGLVESDLQFLREMAAHHDTWAGLYIPNQQLDALAQSTASPDEAIQRLIGQQNDPVVRHRLDTFAKRLKALGVHGRPDHVVLEFVREDFMGKQAKMELSKFMKQRAEERKQAREEAAKAGATEKSAGLKLELLRAQGGRCLYTDAGLEPSRLDEYEIEHIVPRSRGGPDAVFNYVLTTQAANDEKDDRTPYEWLSSTAGWDAYVNRVRSRSLALRNKKVQLLISPAAEELVERYTALAETAWIAKLAQTIVGLHFGWCNGVDEQGNKRVTVISGGLTGRIRRKYGLNRILNPNAQDEEEAEKKNRSDDRHHALDAMVISFIPGWARDAKKEGFFRFPEGVNREFFEKEIQEVNPRYIAFQKPHLEEKFYGVRNQSADELSGKPTTSRTMVRRMENVGDLPYKSENARMVFDVTLKAAYKRLEKVRDPQVRNLIKRFLDEKQPDERAWAQKVADGFYHPNGSLIRRLLLDQGSPTEYAPMGKDNDGESAWKRGEPHKGQIIYWDEVGNLAVCPVYAHGSFAKEIVKIEALGGKARYYGSFRSDCAVKTIREIPADRYQLVVRNEKKQKRRIPASKPLPPCELTLRTIVTEAMTGEFSLADGTRVVAPLEVWVDAGLTRLN